MLADGIGISGTDRIGIERLCVFDMPPVQFVSLAADLGCRYIGIGLRPMRFYNPHNYPDWSLRDDPTLRREMIAALRDRDVSISLCEGIGLRPNADVREYAADLDVLCELGGARINAASMDRDLSRTLEGFAVLAEMADARGIETTIEIGPGPIRNLPTALAAVRHVGRRNFRLLIDTMHFFRFGGNVADITAIDPDIIGYVQLCDAPLVSKYASYMDEALYERMAPGDGELPLLGLLAALARHLIISVEIPQRSKVQAGMTPHQRVGSCVAATRQLLTRAVSQ
jgi:sugar phosphate isomerase/epimerase